MFWDIISILDNNIPKFLILVAILFLCKLEGQDIRIIFGIHHFWTQHTQIDLKSHRYCFYLDLHLRCLYSWNSPNLWYSNMLDQLFCLGGALVFKGGYDMIWCSYKKTSRKGSFFQRSIYARTLKRVFKTAKFGKKGMFFWQPFKIVICV